VNVLLVGAGAVGQVYGRHLQKGGARVAFFVKPKYAEEARRGFTMYPVARRDRWEPVRFEGFDVVTDLEAVAARRWDQVWLCVSSTALQGDWLAPFLAAAGAAGQGTLVTLQPGLLDRQALAERWPEQRLVSGLITLIAWQAPLPGHAEPREPGVAYWFPFGTPNPFGGPPDLARDVADALRVGGCPAVVSEDVARPGALGSSALIPLIAGLEVAGWSFAALRGDPILAIAAAAGREAARVAAAHVGGSAGPAPLLLRPGLVRPLIPLLPKLVPFDLETYLAYHFTKVGDQTRLMLATYAARGRALGQPVGAIEALAERLDASRAAAVRRGPDAPGRSVAG
jgi:2-dehydropantoate 2-reductase